MKRIALGLLVGAGLLTVLVDRAGLLAQSAEVEIDFSARDKASPVADLKKEEIQIQDDGKRVELKELTSVTANGTPAPGDGREIVLLLDDTGVPMNGTQAVQQIANIFAQAAGPGDNLNVVRFHTATDELVKDRQVAFARIAAYQGGSSNFSPDTTEWEMFGLIAKLTRKLGEMAPHRRSAIVCIGSPVVCNPTERSDNAPRDEYPRWIEAVSSAARAHTIVYAAVPTRVAIMGAGLAQRTGGQMFAGLTNYSSAIEQVYGDLSQYYIATYAPPESKKDLRSITVRTTRKNTTMKARERRGK
jgi:hypothetical protein